MSKDRKRHGVARQAGADDPGCASKHGLIELDRESSLALLGNVDVGRVAWADGERVMVFPLNFVLEGEDIYAQTTSAALLAAAESQPRLSFQGDDFEPSVRTGWTVLVSGPADEVEPGAEADRVRELVRPWRKNGPFRLLHIHIEEVSGRRLLLRPGSIESLYIP